jgi:hypothetical protein
LRKLIVAATSELGAVKMSPYVWVLDCGWCLVIVNINVTKRAGRESYSVITAIHWLWDEKEHISIDFGRTETEPVEEGAPDANDRLEAVVADATRNAQQLLDQVRDVRTAYQAVVNTPTQNPDDPRKQFHRFVLGLLSGAAEAEALYRPLIRSCYGPQAWLKRLRDTAQRLHSVSSRKQQRSMVADIIRAARRTKRLPDAEITFNENGE